MCDLKSACCLIFASLACAVLAAKLPPDWKLCKRTSDINACLVDAVNTDIVKLAQGLPDLKIASIDPLEVPSLTIGQGNGPVNVVQHFKNVKIYGISSTRVRQVQSDIDNYSMYLETFSPFLTLTADYQLNGKVLVLPIQGEGKCNITLLNVKATEKLEGEKLEKKGKTYETVHGVLLTLEPERVIFQFENLFNGNKELGDSMNALLNDNWHELFEDVKHGYEETLGIIFGDVANKVYSKVPYNELYAAP